MPEQPDDFEPTEADIDLVIEESTSKPIKPENLAAGITSMRQRIERLEAEKTKLLDQLETADGSCRLRFVRHLASVNNDIVLIRERLVHYEAQYSKQN